MLRVRKYRIFVALSIFFIVGLYYLHDAGASTWTNTVNSRTFRNFGGSDPYTPLDVPGDVKPPSPQIDSDEGVDIRLAKDALFNQAENASPEGFPQIALPGAEPITSSNPPTKETSIPDAGKELTPVDNDGFKPAPTGQRQSVKPTSTAIYWSKVPEHYPLPSASLIHLPSGKPKTIPRVQFDFKKETAKQKEDRLQKLQSIKDVFLRHWKGYKEFAYEHDELKPVSGGFKDPFAGWRATLVDSLDTLWIMGLKDEFEDAVNVTAGIDFHTTERYQLPLFEVSIRYLGGLLGAYDVSGQKYDVLLKKAEELAELLFGTFDTPNRMPATYYEWQPDRQRIPHLGTRNAILAEIGSLTLEYTRLAQLTKNQKYYDAVARIMHNFDAWQDSTTLPGLWPQDVDASGRCTVGTISTHSNSMAPIITEPNFFSAKDDDPREGKDKTSFAGDIDNKLVTKRQADDAQSPQCSIDGFASSWTADKYGLGAMADSVYEYLPKTFLLLGGLNDRYRHMHEKAMAAIKRHLLYKPMIQDKDRSILFTGTMTTNGNKDDQGFPMGSFDAQTGHLTCFVGGMVGLGAKIFKNDEELEMAKKLADGCVWAYEQTVTGIMPEDFTPIVCESLEDPCPYNQTAWWDAIDPFANQHVADELKRYQQDLKTAHETRIAAEGAAKKVKEMTEPAKEETTPTGQPKAAVVSKRQLDDQTNMRAPTRTAEEIALNVHPELPEVVMPKSLPDMMQTRIKNERLTPGISKIGGRAYM